MAERAVSFYRLAQEISLCGVDIEPKWIINPAVWMLFCQCTILGFELRYGHYTDLASPSSKGKRQRYNNFIKNSEHLVDPKVSRSKTFGEVTTTPLGALLNEGIRIASQDNKFWEKYWLPFIKTQRQCERDLRESKLKCTYLDSKGILKIVERKRSLKE